MRYAIVSDLHANLTAWKTVLVDIADQKADAIICLGDVVGYGPNPVEVLESVYRHVRTTVMGNHDAAVCCRCDPEYFTDRAKAAVLRHQKQLSSQALIWLKHLPYLHQEADFCCTHGDFSNPKLFNYIVEPESALPSWQTRKEQLLFVGHSHLPGIYVLGESGKPHFVSPGDFVMEKGKRYIVNPGSVGYPRAGDCHSTYCIYDSVTKTVFFRVIPFDFTGYKESMRALGYSEDSWLLAQEIEHRIEVVRAQPNFSRAPLPGGQSKPRDLPQQPPPRPHAPLPSPRNARRFRPWLAVLALGGLLLLSLTFFSASPEKDAHPARQVEVPPFELTPLTAYPLTPPNRNLLAAWPTNALPPGGRIPGWRYFLQIPDQQRLRINPRTGDLTLIHDGPLEIRIESPWIDLSATEIEAFRLRASALPGPDFAGSLLGGIRSAVRNEKGEFTPIKNEPFELRKKRKRESGIAFTRKITVPKRATHIQFFLDGEFKGQIDLSAPYLGQEINLKEKTKETR